MPKKKKDKADAQNEVGEEVKIAANIAIQEFRHDESRKGNQRPSLWIDTRLPLTLHISIFPSPGLPLVSPLLNSPLYPPCLPLSRKLLISSVTLSRFVCRFHVHLFSKQRRMTGTFDRCCFFFFLTELEFPSSLTNLERKFVHRLAATLGLKSKSKG